MSGIEGIRFDFRGYARVTYPLRIFRILAEGTRPVHISKISNQEFIYKDRKTYVPLNEKFLAGWLIKILLNIFLNFEKNIPSLAQLSGPQRKKLTKAISDISGEFSREFSQHLSCGFSRDFIRDISWGLRSNLDRYFSRYFSREFSRYFSRDFIRDFRRDLSLEFSRDFSRDFIRGFNRDFSRDFNRDFRRKLSQQLSRRLSRDFIRYFIRDFRVFSQDCSDFISRLYHKKYHEVLDWDKLTVRDDRMIYELMKEKLEKGAEEFIERFFNSLYKYLFEDKFELTFDFFGAGIQSFSGKGIAGVTRPGNLLFIANPFIISFAFEVLLTATLGHYSLNMLADLKSRFYGKEMPNDEKMEKAVIDYCERNPFYFYFLTFSWDFYAQAFNEQNLRHEDIETRDLALAAFVVSAARVSLTAGVPCEGEEWDKTLAAAQQSESPFVQISLTLYKINNAADSTERQENESLLKQQLANFKADYPQYYRLIGFQ
jgi:hypothetical protein